MKLFKYLIFFLATVTIFAQECPDKDLNSAIDTYNKKQTAQNIALVNYHMIKRNDCILENKIGELKKLIKEVNISIEASNHSHSGSVTSSSPSTTSATSTYVDDFGTGLGTGY